MNCKLQKVLGSCSFSKRLLPASKVPQTLESQFSQMNNSEKFRNLKVKSEDQKEIETILVFDKTESV